MRTNALNIAKITRPRLQSALPRKRLLDLLNKGRTPVTWVMGPGGSGKTTLAASWLDTRKMPCLWYQIDEGDGDTASFFYYLGLAAQKAAPHHRKPLPLLTPQYLMGIPAFARNFFENLYSRLRPPFAVVFDNYQDAPEQSQLHAVVSSALSHIPEGIEVLVLSRGEPPSVFTSLRANGKMLLVGWKELRFTLEESKQIIERKKKMKLTDRAIAELHKRTEGWAAGLVLLSEQARQGDAGPESAGRIAELSQEAVFDYFAGEIFGNLDSETTDFLLMSSFLPKMTVHMAEKMTDQDNAGYILNILNRNNFFTEKLLTAEPTYLYHPLFREYLMTQMKASVNPAGLLRVQRRAATVLEEAGQIEDAIGLYLQTSNWESAIRLILGHAQTMMAQGRNKTLESWLGGLPQEIVASTPWLLYWSGMSRLGFDLPGARKDLKRAFTRFIELNDHPGMVVSWSSIVDAVIYEWDDFYPLDELLAEYFEKIEKALPESSPEVQMRAINAIGLALFIRRPDHPRTEEFIERSVLFSLNNNTDYSGLPALMSANIYYSWIGKFSQCDVLLGEVKRLSSSSQASKTDQILAGVMLAGKHLWDASSAEESEKRISEGLKVGTTTGLHFWDHMLFALGIYASLIRGEMNKAEWYLEEMRSGLIPSRKGTYVAYNMLNCLYKFLKGNFAEALNSAESGLMFQEKTGYMFARIALLHEMAHVLHALKEKGAEEYLEQALDMAVLTRSAIFEFGCRLTRALFAFDGGKDKDGVELLREALLLGRKHSYYSLLWWWDPAAMSRLAVKALEYGIETDYVTDLIRIRKLMPEEPPVHLENWPWPVKIYTLGSFRIELSGKHVVFAGKVQKKPLELLKFVIAAGGRDVPEEWVIDALWPDAEGDAGHKSFENTVARLRKLLGSDKYLILQEGKLTLDPRSCWVDAWAVDRIIRAVHEWKKGTHPSNRALELAEKALSLNTGPFLAAETDKAWTVSPREKLKSNCIKMVELLVSHWKSRGAWGKAIEYLTKGLEIDELAEDLRRDLMVCYRETGRVVDAIKTYKHLKEVLAKSLGIEPSQATETLYREMIEKKRNHRPANRSKQ
jgi:DNA-binding SARP family transcriptional activator